MGTISDKLTYLNTTKTQLKGMINYGLDENNKITNETTFRDYVKSIFKAFLESLNNHDTLFTNLPKKSGTGVNITLNGTANAPMKIKLSASEMSQSGTPTPSSPQDIHKISGSNTIEVEGENLWNENAQVFTNQALLSNPTKDSNNVWTFTSSGSGYAFAISKKTLQAGTYTFSFSCVGGNAIVLNGSTTLNNTFTLNEETEITIRVFKSGAVAGDVIKLSNVMLEYGNQATPYEPYVSQEADINLGDIEYCKKGNYEDEFIRTSGKNLFDKTSNIVLNKYIGGDGTIQNEALNWYQEDYIEVKPSTNYIMSSNSSQTVRIALYDENKTFISRVYSTGNIQATTTATTKYIRLSGYNNINDNIMLNEGTTDLPYEPYGTNEWYIKKSIPKIVLNENSNISTHPNGTNSFEFTLSNLYQHREMVTIMSDYFRGVTWNERVSGGNNIIYGITDAGVTKAIIRNTDFTSLNDLKTWLSTHNTEVYYILATPTYTQITGTLAEQLENIYQKLKSFKGTTNISQVNNDLPFILNVQALEDLE